MKTNINWFIVLPQNPVYSFQDVVHEAIVLGDVNGRNSIATAGLKRTFTITRVSQYIRKSYILSNRQD
jgi:hypothetical protein